MKKIFLILITVGMLIFSGCNDKNEFYETGINLTYENKNDEFDSIKVKNKVCSYPSWNSGIDSVCNMLILIIGDYESMEKKSFNELIFIIKKYNARIVELSPRGRIMTIELKNDKFIDEIQEELKSNGIYASYNLYNELK